MRHLPPTAIARDATERMEKRMVMVEIGKLECKRVFESKRVLGRRRIKTCRWRGWRKGKDVGVR